MQLKSYSKEYSGVVCSWLEARDLDSGLIQDLPKVGVIAFSDDQPVAVGFLRQCEGGYGLLDSFITDPTADPEVRDKAMDLLIKYLIALAKDSDLKQLLGFTVDNFTLCRAKKHGMKATPFTTLVLPLKGKS